MAKQVVTALSKSDIYGQLSDLTATQAQSTMDFLQDVGTVQFFRKLYINSSVSVSF